MNLKHCAHRGHDAIPPATPKSTDYGISNARDARRLCGQKPRNLWKKPGTPAPLTRAPTSNPKTLPRAAAQLEPMDTQRMMRLADAARSPHLWRYVDGQWELRHTVWANQ